MAAWLLRRAVVVVVEGGNLSASGLLDTTFDTDGIVTTDIGAGHDYARSVAIQTDGKIVVAGRSFNDYDYDFALVRYR